MGQRVRIKKDRTNAKGYAVKKPKGKANKKGKGTKKK